MTVLCVDCGALTRPTVIFGYQFCVRCLPRRAWKTYLRSHEPPRNSGEGTAVNGPMPLEGDRDANAPA